MMVKGEHSEAVDLLLRLSGELGGSPQTLNDLGVGPNGLVAAGYDANLLLNVPPNRNGVISDVDAERLRSFRAALDVWWVYPAGTSGRPFHDPFHELPNVVMTPHNANAIPGQRRWATEAAASLPSRVTMRLLDMLFLLFLASRSASGLPGGRGCEPVHLANVNQFTCESRPPPRV